MSIAAQSYLPHELVISDEASTDSTVEIIKSFTGIAPFTVHLYQNREKKDVVVNYSDTISRCKGDYVALCDQDDLWLPDKLASSLLKINEAEKTYGTIKPLLLHTDLIVIDISGTIIAPSFMKLRQIKPIQEDSLRTLLVQNYVTGSTVLINRPLMEAALPIPEEAVMHDWWLALVAAAAGEIIFIDQLTVLYRQHEANVVGASGFYTLNNIKKIADLKAREKELAAAIMQAIALKGHLEKINYSQIPRWLPDFLCGIKLGGIKATEASNKYGVRKQGLIRNILYKLMLLKAGYIKYLVNSDLE